MFTEIPTLLISYLIDYRGLNLILHNSGPYKSSLFAPDTIILRYCAGALTIARLVGYCPTKQKVTGLIHQGSFIRVVGLVPVGMHA